MKKNTYFSTLPIDATAFTNGASSTATSHALSPADSALTLTNTKHLEAACDQLDAASASTFATLVASSDVCGCSANGTCDATASPKTCSCSGDWAGYLCHFEQSFIDAASPLVDAVVQSVATNLASDASFKTLGQLGIVTEQRDLVTQASALSAIESAEAAVLAESGSISAILSTLEIASNLVVLTLPNQAAVASALVTSLPKQIEPGLAGITQKLEVGSVSATVATVNALTNFQATPEFQVSFPSDLASCGGTRRLR